MDYCKRLKELRFENGYTQEQIAFILHTRQEQYSKYESGKRELPIKHLITHRKICQITSLPYSAQKKPPVFQRVAFEITDFYFVKSLNSEKSKVAK